jgi:hypothetical protein
MKRLTWRGKKEKDEIPSDSGKDGVPPISLPLPLASSGERKSPRSAASKTPRDGKLMLSARRQEDLISPLHGAASSGNYKAVRALLKVFLHLVSNCYRSSATTVSIFREIVVERELHGSCVCSSDLSHVIFVCRNIVCMIAATAFRVDAAALRVQFH